MSLSRADCLDLLRQAHVGRVGVSIAALPAVLPVNFTIFDGDVLFRTIPGTHLDAATAGSVVAFEVDSYESGGGDDGCRSVGWSVMVQGRASEVTKPAELARARSLPLQSWALDGASDRFVRIATSVITGRRLNTTQYEPALSHRT